MLHSVDLALRAAIAAIGLLLVIAAIDLINDGGVEAWLRIALNIVTLTAVALAIRHRSGAGRLLEVERQRDDATRAAAARYSGILAIASDAIIVIDASHRIVHFNNGAESVFGYRSDEVVGQPLALLLPERFREVHEQHIAAFDRGADTARPMGARRSVSGLRKDGTEFPAEAAISKLDVPGEPRIFTVVLRDITDRRRSEETEQFLSRAGSSLYRSLDPVAVRDVIRTLAVPALADACLVDILDVKGNVVRTAYATDHRTHAKLRILSEEYSVDVHGDAPFARAIRGEDNTGPLRMNEEWISAHGGDPEQQALWRGVEAGALLSVPFRVGDRIIGALTLLDRHDGTVRFNGDMRRVVDEFARAAAVALENARLYASARRATHARDEVLAIVSHELRNPISAIAMGARALHDNLAGGENERREMLEAITDATRWMQRLIQDLLDVAAIESGHLPIDTREATMGSIVRTAASMVSGAIEQRAVELEIDIPSDLPTVMVDSNRMGQVVVNLLGNAIKFSQRGGRVLIRVMQTADGVMTSVEDGGMGIDPNTQKHIFDRFWQAKPGLREGYGLGLTISRGIVEAHGGRIWVESSPGTGSTFSFVLPVVE